MAFETEVQRGIALLDEKVPGWRTKVDLDRLDMALGWPSRTGCGCILTQVFGSYGDGLQTLDFDTWHSDDDEFGFDVADARSDHRYRELTAAWKRALTPGGAP
jgi:hypothetical protein